MSLLYLLDTNVLSEPARPAPDRRVTGRLRAHRGEMATAAPVWNELLYGLLRAPRSRSRAALHRYLFEVVRPGLEILPYDAAAAEWHAAERARLRALGRTPAFVDGQVAAVARVNELVLVTRNVSDYRLFERLQLEDWFSPEGRASS